MKTTTLKEATLKELKKEVERRELDGFASREAKQYARIKTTKVKIGKLGYWGPAKCEVLYFKDHHGEGWQYQFHFIINGQLKDFYYDGYDLGLEQEDWSCLIPPGFAEACENCYEFAGSLEEAKKILKKCGYARITEYKYE